MAAPPTRQPFGVDGMSEFLAILIQALYTGAEWALIAVGFGFIARTTNIFHLALGALFSIGGYGVFLMAVQYHLPLIPVIIVASVVAGLFGSAIDKFIYQPVTGLYGQRKVNHLAPFVTSLGVMIVLRNLIQLWFGASPIYVEQPNFGIADIGGAKVQAWNLLKVVISLVACFGFAVWLKRTRAGASATALGQSAEGASVIGVSEKTVRFQIFFATGCLAGLGGSLAILSHPTLPGDGFPIVLYGALISLILPRAGVMVWWIASVGAAFVYAQAITSIGGGWQDTILQGVLMLGIVVSRVVIPGYQRYAMLRRGARQRRAGDDAGGMATAVAKAASAQPDGR
jgi:branched-subunit amino acid ABC-type transport system permease component